VTRPGQKLAGDVDDLSGWGKRKKTAQINHQPSWTVHSIKRIYKPIYPLYHFSNLFQFFFFFFQSVRNARPSTSSFYYPGSTSLQGFPEVIHDCCIELDNGPHPGTRGASLGSLVLTVPSRRSGCACRVDGGSRRWRSAML
jgi:hypothetical protein